MLNAGRAIVWDSALGVGRHKVSDYVMCPKNHTQQHLFIMDGHNSHIIANFIAFCMEYLINLLILLPHILHLLQPLDINIFAPLKRALAEETNAVF